MSNKLKPVSRLTLIFILAVLISGSILTYFSINNISNLKELTEKRVIEEQQEIAESINIEIRNRINEISSEFKNEINPTDLLRDSLLKKANEHIYISMPFIADGKGQVLFPNVNTISGNQFKIESSGWINSEFQKGEKAEFTEKNLAQAKSYYLSCLKNSKEKNDSVKALNALGRISAKQNNYKDALYYYEIIVRQYFSFVGNEGFPYVYYAVSQLLEIDKTNNLQRKLSIVEFFLAKMREGLIPLNYYSKELLGTIEKWRIKNVPENQNRFQTIKNSIVNIEGQLEFIERYKNGLSGMINGGEQEHLPNSENGFFILNPYSNHNGDFILVNKKFENYFGFLIDSRKLFDLVLQEDFQSNLKFEYQIELPKAYLAISKNNQLVYTSQLNPLFPNQVIQIKLRNDKLIDELVKRRSWIYGIASVLLLVAMFLGVFLILRDISREKHLARLRADFISNVTHELKTPLTSIYMFAESLLLRRVKSTSEKDEYLSIIIKESERLKRMINNILEFSKMERNISDYHLVEANLAKTIKAAIHDHDYWLEKEKFELVTDLDENLVAEFDPEKMKQVFSNLISNSIKYSSNSKKIFIGLHRNTNGVVIEVKDHGIGMPEEKVNRIFEKFYRIDQKENIGGTGLGLTVVKEIIEAHNGKITVSSKLGEGSKFSINLNQ